MGRNIADFGQGKDLDLAFNMVQSWREQEISPKSRKTYTRTKPVTNYGSKNGNSKENPAWANNRNNPDSPNYKNRGK